MNNRRQQLNNKAHDILLNPYRVELKDYISARTAPSYDSAIKQEDLLIITDIVNLSYETLMELIMYKNLNMTRETSND